jgi:hypothetical protein
LIRDFVFAGLLWYFVAPWIASVTFGGVLVKSLLWVLFAVAQGTILTGVWVIAHEWFVI